MRHEGFAGRAEENDLRLFPLARQLLAENVETIRVEHHLTTARVATISLRVTITALERAARHQIDGVVLRKTGRRRSPENGAFPAGLNQLEHISSVPKARRRDELLTPVHNAQLHFGEEGSNPNLFHIFGVSLHGET